MGLISYEEALRQATNPDDFALRVSGVSATSDSKWDEFEQHGAAAPPAQARAVAPRAAPRPTPAPSAPQPHVGQSAPRPQPTPAPDPNDPGFEIERF
jgi:twitching motility protein PilT